MQNYLLISLYSDERGMVNMSIVVRAVSGIHLIVIILQYKGRVLGLSTVSHSSQLLLVNQFAISPPPHNH
jgi:hypothetical protein